MTISALLAHVGAKASITAAVARRGLPSDTGDAGVATGAVDEGADTTLPAEGGLTRRTVLAATAAMSGLVVATSAGGTVRPLARLAVLNARSPVVGPQGFPVNTTATAARVEPAATSRDYRLRVVGSTGEPLELTRQDLLALPQHEAVLPIACVEGWSVVKRWTGVSVGTLLARAGAGPGSSVRVLSLQSSGLYRASEQGVRVGRQLGRQVALRVEGEDLHVDHGFPVRLIAPNNPGVLQTKWVGEVRVL